MNLMLSFMLACVVLGLLVRRVGAREHLVMTLLAMTMASLYFFVTRFM
jgi:hypothetical protein